ncbi:MAG: tRNA pseudouridine(55) synthase TruB [Ilumatobacteraceae bacterium]|nr:tRNA pseudouridine(55) synthase TruB [Ilumatobacter sp.]MCO5332075.1 tRNA pseudouridine(55) synthase TruB [Ilumatobacteraceae bacterium]
MTAATTVTAHTVMARRKPPTVHGLAVVDKPAGVTSHDVVGMLRRRFGERQVGHAGTLDPDATGVLLVGVGKGTRLVRFLTDLGKTYTGEVVFGTTTDSLDSTGVVTGTFDMAGLTEAAVREAVRDHLMGPIMQVPPMVSALKVDGRRLHELAREGVEVERAPRPVTVYRFGIEPTADPLRYLVEVHCSKGTYIRSLADDLGRLCGGGAHLHGLRRIAVGSFTVAEAAPPEQAVLLPLATALRDYAQVRVDDATAALVRQGRVLPRPDGDGPWAVLAPEGDLLAVYEPFRNGEAKPAVVVAT